MKRIALFLAMAGLLAVIVIPIAQAEGTPPPLPANKYCLDGETVSLPQDISFGSGSDMVTRPLSQNTAEVILSEPNYFVGGVFYMGYINGTSIVVLAGQSDFGLLATYPKPSVHGLARGACAAAFVSPDRQFWLCYSKWQNDPAVYSRSRATSLYDDGKGAYWVPYAVKSPVSKTNIGNGVYLTCNLPAGMAPTGAAVSTGGGEPFNGGSYAKVPAGNRLDYTQLAG